MSGGHWDYVQSRLTEVIEDITSKIKNNGKKKDLESLGRWDIEWIEKYPEHAYHHKYPDELIEKFKEARLIIAEAQEHMQQLS